MNLRSQLQLAQVIELSGGRTLLKKQLIQYAVSSVHVFKHSVSHDQHRPQEDKLAVLLNLNRRLSCVPFLLSILGN